MLIPSLKTALACLFLSILLATCRNVPSFPKEPVISIESLTRTFNGFSGDNVLLKIRFQDGTGDLGLESGERQTTRPVTRISGTQPFQEYFYTFNSFGQLTDSTRNKFYHNLFIKLSRKNSSGIFEEIVFPDPNFNYNYGFKPLYENNRKTPMEGLIEYNMNLSQPTFKKNDIIKCEIQICDRDKNFSNTVVSEVLTLLME